MKKEIKKEIKSVKGEKGKNTDIDIPRKTRKERKRDRQRGRKKHFNF